MKYALLLIGLFIVNPTQASSAVICSQSGVALGKNIPLSPSLTFTLTSQADLMTVEQKGTYVNFKVQTGKKATNLLKRDDDYYLDQIHFHKAQEHLLAGHTAVPADNIEVHFVHVKHNPTGTLQPGNTTDSLAVVAVIIQGNAEKPHSGVASLLKLISEQQANQTEIDLGDIIDLPSFFPSNKSGFDYIGSLTAGKGTEYLKGVKWWVFNTPISITNEQMASLKNAKGVLHSARAIQACP